MEKYENLNGNSNVNAYRIEDSCIQVQFKDGSIYQYSYSKAGQHNVDNMKLLAKGGCGLNSFIMKNVKKLYD